MLSNLLEKHGVKYEDLNATEKETYHQWEQLLSKNELTLQNVKDFIPRLAEAVQRELTDLKETTSFWAFLFGWKKDFYLKARLRNYLMIQDFLSSPDKDKKYIEQSIQNINK